MLSKVEYCKLILKAVLQDIVTKKIPLILRFLSGNIEIRIWSFHMHKKLSNK